MSKISIKYQKTLDVYFPLSIYQQNKKTRLLEFEYAKLGFYLISNSSANRWTKDVPMIIPEINHDHADIIPIQQKLRGFTKKGFVAVKPNCSIQSYVTALYALEKAGFPIDKVQVTTLQSLSGGGQALIKSKKMKNNVIPIGGEESKTETEPLKIFAPSMALVSKIPTD